MSDKEAVENIRAALSALGGESAADRSRIAIAGYCQTGRHPLVFAAEVPEMPVKAVVVWYGAASRREWDTNERQPKPLTDIIAALPCPVFGAFGAEDHVISLDDVLRLRNACEQYRKSYEVHMFAGAPHGWLNETMPGRYRKPQADAAWAKQQAFLARALNRDTGSNSVSWHFESTTPADYDFSKNVRLE